jgi:hypothetical protein
MVDRNQKFSYLADEELAQRSIDKALGEKGSEPQQPTQSHVKTLRMSKSTKGKLCIVLLMYGMWAFSLMELNPAKWTLNDRVLICLATFIVLLIDYVAKDINQKAGVKVLTDKEIDDIINKNQ